MCVQHDRCRGLHRETDCKSVSHNKHQLEITGSLAAAIQSVVYGGATGGLFSIFQSIGATAVVAPPLALALGVAGIVGGAYHFANRGSGDYSNPNTGGSRPDAPSGGGTANVDADLDDDDDFYKECECTDCECIDCE